MSVMSFALCLYVHDTLRYTPHSKDSVTEEKSESEFVEAITESVAVEAV